MYRLIFPLIALIAFAPGALGLPRGAGGSVQGTVRDAATGAPLENTNVYLSATTLGTQPAVIGEAGNPVDPLTMEVIGDWTKYRVADMRPLDYNGGL